MLMIDRIGCPHEEGVDDEGPTRPARPLLGQTAGQASACTSTGAGHVRWRCSTVRGNELRCDTRMGSTWIVDLRHYLTQAGTRAKLPGRARTLANYWTEIIAQGSNSRRADNSAMPPPPRASRLRGNA